MEQASEVLILVFKLKSHLKFLVLDNTTQEPRYKMICYQNYKEHIMVDLEFLLKDFKSKRNLVQKLGNLNLKVWQIT